MRHADYLALLAVLALAACKPAAEQQQATAPTAPAATLQPRRERRRSGNAAPVGGGTNASAPARPHAARRAERPDRPEEHRSRRPGRPELWRADRAEALDEADAALGRRAGAARFAVRSGALSPKSTWRSAISGDRKAPRGRSMLPMPVIFYGEPRTGSRSGARPTSSCAGSTMFPGSTDAQRRWHIERIDWASVDAVPVRRRTSAVVGCRGAPALGRRFGVGAVGARSRTPSRRNHRRTR